MRLQLSKFALLFTLLFLFSCTTEFNKVKYKNRFVRNKWTRRKILIIKQGTYNNPLIKKEVKRGLIIPKSYNIDDW